MEVPRERIAPEPATRPYRSPLRARQAAQTQETILHALAEEIVDGRLHELSVVAVARRAEVSERTVYRHFPGVEAMIDGLRELVGREIEERMGGRPYLRASEPGSPEALLEFLPALYETFEAIGSPARAMAIVTFVRGDDPERVRRRESLRRTLAPELAHLDEAAAHAVFETIYQLAGSITWFLLTRDGRLTTREAGEGAARVLRALTTGLRAERAAVAPG
jgi:AcrR family transcriptional regulator